MPDSRRNILLIVVDQWRGDHLPAGHGGTLDLPNLARLCATGTRFANHFCNASPCGPARMSMLTGQYAMNHRVVQNGIPLDGRKTNLALELRRGGYLPALVGYTSWIPDPRDTAPDDPRYRMFGAVMPGFMPVRSFEEPEFEAYFGYLRRLGYVLPRAPFDIWNGAFDGDGITPSPIDAAHSDTAWLTDGALDYLAGCGDEDWFLHLAYWRPHPPFTASSPYHAFVAPEDTAPPVRAPTLAEEAAVHPFLAHRLQTSVAGDYLQGVEGLSSAVSTDLVARVRAVYCGLIKEIDDHLGRVFDHLDRTGQWDDTLIVLTSDHGEMLGDHHLFGKETYFDAAFHVPLVVRDPRPEADATRGTTVQRFTEHVDLMPTILQWLGRRVPRQCDGRSLLTLLRDPDADWRDAAFMELDFRDLRRGSHRRLGIEADRCGLAILRDSRFKYVHFAGFGPLLFDLEADPDERVDRAEDPGYRDALIDCMGRLLDWRIAGADRTLTAASSSPEGLVGWPDP